MERNKCDLRHQYWIVALLDRSSYSENVTLAWPRVKRLVVNVRGMPEARLLEPRVTGTSRSRLERERKSIHRGASRLHYGLLEREREDDIVNHRTTATPLRLAAKRKRGRERRPRTTATSPIEGSVYQQMLQLFIYSYLASAGMVSSILADESSSAFILWFESTNLQLYGYLRVERAWLLSNRGLSDMLNVPA